MSSINKDAKVEFDISKIPSMMPIPKNVDSDVIMIRIPIINK
jgi:hypothetical protein